MIEWVVSSSILIGVIIVLRYGLRGKISLRLQYALWGIVLVRLLMPFSIGSSVISVINAGDAVQEQPAIQRVAEFGQTRVQGQSYENAYEQVAQEYESKGVDVAALEGRARETLDQEVNQRVEGKQVGDILKTGAQIVWLIGASVMGLWFVLSNLRFAVRLKRSRRTLGMEGVSLPLYVSDGVDTPCLFGILSPKIYVTEKAAGNETILRHAVAHEMTHLRHGDHIWATLRGVCLALHWYNPLVWWAAILSRKDGELACDEGTIKRIGEQERAEYGRTLIAMTCQKHTSLLTTATTMTGSRNGLRERIVLIAKRPKMAIHTLIAVLLIATVAVGCTFTGEQENLNTDGEVVIQVDEGITAPQAVVDYAKDRVQIDIDYHTDLGSDANQSVRPYKIIGAEITALTEISTDSATEDRGVVLYRLEYRIQPDQPDHVTLAGGMSMEDGWLSELGSVGQPYLLLFWENTGTETLWQRIWATSTDSIESDYYGTYEMHTQYDDPYTAEAMESYKMFETPYVLNGVSIVLEPGFAVRVVDDQCLRNDDNVQVAVQLVGRDSNRLPEITQDIFGTDDLATLPIDSNGNYYHGDTAEGEYHHLVYLEFEEHIVIADFICPEDLKDKYVDKFARWAASAVPPELSDEERWESEVIMAGLSVSKGGAKDYEAIGQVFAQAYVDQYVENTSLDNPQHSRDAVVLSMEPWGESLIESPEKVIYWMEFACAPVDIETFSEGWWIAGWLAPIDQGEYPQYEGYMIGRRYIVLSPREDGRWACVGAGTGGYGGWGYLDYENAERFDEFMEDRMPGGNNIYTNEVLIRALPFVNWNDFLDRWVTPEVDGLSFLFSFLDEHCLTEGQVYGPEETRMWSDVYPDDQIYRNMYVMLAALNSDGAIAESFEGILAKQKAYDLGAFNYALQQLTREQQSIITMLSSR